MAKGSGRSPIFLDYQSTTPIDADVLSTMMPFLTTHFGNPHSADHRYGWEAQAAIEVAQAECAALIGAAPQDIIFTSGATEANNLAIKGVMEALVKRRSRLVTVISEHSCVREAARATRRWGADVIEVSID
ncbi:MAG: aminotransferase class V-fold PLP-dependent enzyme, partial [Pseudomonadota bacterium]